MLCKNDYTQIYAGFQYVFLLFVPLILSFYKPSIDIYEINIDNIILI